MPMTLVLLIRLILGAIAAMIAANKGRNAGGWFVGGFFLGLIGIIIVAVLPNRKEQADYRAHADTEMHRLREQLRQERMKNESFRLYAGERLDAHDHQLGVDTRSRASLPAPDISGPIPLQPLDDRGADDPARYLDELVANAEADRRQSPGGAVGGETPVWFYETAGQATGPVTESEIRRLLRAGRIGGQTLLWTAGLDEWTLARQVRQFVDEIPAT